jgi:hypothetical protein
MSNTSILQSSNSSDLNNLEFERLLAFLLDDLDADDDEPLSMDHLSPPDDSTYESLGIFDSFTLHKYDGMKIDRKKEAQGLDVEVVDYHQDDESNALPISHVGCQNDTVVSTSLSPSTIYLVMTKTHDGSSSNSSISNRIVDMSTQSRSAAGAA